MSRTTRTLALALVLCAPASSFAQDGPARRLFQRLTGRAGRVETISTPAPAPAYAASVPGGDPHGFATVLNGIRTRFGLSPLRYDPDLSAWASRNNAAMCRRGLGHHVVPGCNQNCGWNYTDPNEVAQGWMDSPGHRANMLNPAATTFGIAYGPGPYWTLNLR
jgi:hypothetical protein